MDNHKIHEGLERADLRDFFSQMLVKNQLAHKNNRKKLADYNIGGLEWAIQDCLGEIEFHQKKLQLLKEYQAIVTLINMQGWMEFDVSDYTKSDSSSWMSFIGTEDEYNSLMKLFKKQK